MFSWTPFPFVRLTLLFCVGILLGIYVPDILEIGLAKIIFGLLGVLFMVVAYLRSQGKLKTINAGVIGLLVILLAGYIQVYDSTDSRKSSHFMNDVDTIRYYKAVVTKQAQEKENSWKIEAKIVAVQHGNLWKERTGNVLLYFSKAGFSKPYQYGDVLLM